MNLKKPKEIGLLGCQDILTHLNEQTLCPVPFENIEEILTTPTNRKMAAIVLHAASFSSVDARQLAIKSIKKRFPLADVIIWAPRANAQVVRESLKSGARDIILSPSARVAANNLESIVVTPDIPSELREFRKTRPTSTRFEGLISRSRAMWDIFELCVRIASTDASVLVLGETGTGKEMLARAIHRRSGRSGRFVAVNCAAIPQTLIDSELFGHVKGAFTGAVKDKPGLFRYAENGTLFLDEIGDIPDSVQFSLLRALQEGAIRPVGSNDEIPVNTRVIAATSSPLEERVATGQFRGDLLYRLDVMRIVLPPLRERIEDIVFLFLHFAKLLAKEYKVAVPSLSEDFLDALIKYAWPGNVRQLENIAERVVLSQPNERLTGTHFTKILRPYDTTKPDQASSLMANETASTPPAVDIDPMKSLADTLERVVAPLEKQYLEACLRYNKGAIELSAKQAGINRRTLLRKMRKYTLNKDDYR